MALWDKEQKAWLHGAVSLLAGFLLFWFFFAAPPARNFCVDGVNTLLYYPEKPFMTLRNVVKYSSNWVLERATLKERVNILETENQALSEALQRAEVKLPQPKAGYISANITLRYPEEWWQEVRIDKGSKDGVRDGAAVTSDGYLVGRIVRVGERYSWVELITSSSFLIAATIDETRDLGVINGDNMGNLKLLYVQDNRPLKRDMRISTSLMNELIPPGVPIGFIIAVGRSRDGFPEIEVQAGAHLTQLYSVEVFTPAGDAE